MGVDLDKWMEKVRRCEYLAEDELKALCEYVSVLAAAARATLRVVTRTHVGSTPLQREQLLAPGIQVKEILVEESNVQPVNSPVTVSLLPRCYPLV